VRTIKLFAVIGLAVALVAVPALAQQQKVSQGDLHYSEALNLQIKFRERLCTVM
jgi:hypothetical protein